MMRPTRKQFAALLSGETRIVEICTNCGTVADRLLASGSSLYLALVPDERRRDALVREFPALRDHIAVCGSPGAACRNNADVLILSGWSAVRLAKFRRVRHARLVALKLARTPACWLAVVLMLVQWMLGRFGRPSIVRCGEDPVAPRLIVFPVRRRAPHNGARRYIPHTLGVEGFLRRLQTAGIRYSVLRWFETLPQITPGEDLDILVDDADLEAVRDILDDGPGIQPVDLYSVTGLPGADFRGMPYYPPYLAEEVLEHAIVQADLCRVPGPREHFLSLAYHALYHKGYESGLIRRGQQTRRRVRTDHDYQSELRQLAERLGIDVSITLEDLDEYLDSQGWRPAHDMLIRLVACNRWLRSRVQHPQQDGSVDDGVAVFLIREEALQRGGIDRAVRLLEEHGFQIVAVHRFDARAVKMIARSVRGGNWGRGPWPISGGPPVAAVVVHDASPLPVSRGQRRRFPFLANARLLCKEQIRDAFNEGVPVDQHCNVVHSSDNGREALDYLRIVAPDAINGVLEVVKAQHPDLQRTAA